MKKYYFIMLLIVFIILKFEVHTNAATSAKKQTNTKQVKDIELCKDIIKTHAFLSRAQFQCGFSKYNDEMLESAKECANKIPKNVLKERMNHGFSVFDKNESERGHDQLCNDILNSFSNYVAK